MRFLIVEDDEVLGEALCQRFKKQGHGTDLAVNGDEADKILKHQDYDLIILDINLPGLNGDQVLAHIRQRKSQTPVLILTAQDAVKSRIELLDLGADDYLAKPFDFGELEARCRALLRRNQGKANSTLEYGNLILDMNTCTVIIDGQEVSLTQRELRLLEVFLTHTDRVLSKEELIEHIYSFDDYPSPNAIELYVARLRKKLAASQINIKTLRGLGYLLEEMND